MTTYFGFVSYSTRDLVWAQRVRNMFLPLGLEAFVAEESWRVGQSSEVILQAIRQTPIFVLVWSKAASESSWVRHEVGAAHGAKIPIVVFNVEPDVPLPEPIRGCKYADVQKDSFEALLAVQHAVIAVYLNAIKIQKQEVARRREEERRVQQEKANAFGASLLIGGIGFAVLKGLSK